MFAIAALVLSIFLIAAVSVRRVPAGQVYSLSRHGKTTRLLQPGLHLVVPLLERVTHRIDLGGQMLRFEATDGEAEARDLRGTVYWQVLEPERAEAVIDQADQLIRQGMSNALRESVQAATSDRLRLGSTVKQALNTTLRPRGMMVTRVDLEAA